MQTNQNGIEGSDSGGIGETVRDISTRGECSNDNALTDTMHSAPVSLLMASASATSSALAETDLSAAVIESISKEEVAKFFARLDLVFKRNSHRDAITEPAMAEVYANLLAHLPAESVRRGFTVCAQTLTRFPYPADLVQASLATAVSLTEQELAAAFTEWDRRYREEPERFMSEAEHLLKQTPETYGEACAPYLLQILSELRGQRG